MRPVTLATSRLGPAIAVAACLVATPAEAALFRAADVSASIDLQSGSARDRTPDAAGDVVAELDLGVIPNATFVDSVANYGRLGASVFTASSPDITRAQGVAQADFDDEIVVTSTTLAHGTPIQVELQFWIDGTLTLQRDEFSASGDLARSNLSALVQASLIQNALGSQFVSLSVSDGRDGRDVVAAGGDSFTRLYSAGNTLQTAVFDTLVGNTLNIGGQIRVIGTSGAGTSARADFLNSAHLTLRGLTSADLRFIGTGNNRDYGVEVVPAPGGLLLLLTALGGIALRQRRA
jgi:hypothetical protein